VKTYCHQAIFMNHASGAVAPPDADSAKVGDAIWQRAKRRGLVQGAAGVPVMQDELRAHPCIFQVYQQVPGLLHYPPLN
jgi:hypothetical protein